MKLNDPRIQFANRYGDNFNASQVIIISVVPGGLMGVSWGKTKKLCDETEKLMKVAQDAVYDKMTGKL